MFTAKPFLRAAAASVPLHSVRAFSSSGIVLEKKSRARVPSLADIGPESTDEFNKKQKAFRERLVEAQKAKDASALSSSSSPATKPKDTEAAAKGPGSLSTAKGSATGASDTALGRKQGPISNLLYGTKEGRELDAQIEASFSQLLARGKYMHSISLHSVKPDKVDEYVDLVGKWYPRMASIPENKVHLVGSWRTEVGDCDTFGKPSCPFLT